MNDIFLRWKEYERSPYHDVEQDKTNDHTALPTPAVFESEVEEAIRRLPKNKAAGLAEELLKTKKS